MPIRNLFATSGRVFNPFRVNKVWLLEGLVLAGASPFLLFPSRLILGTFLALLGLVFIEIVPPWRKWRSIPAATPVDSILLPFTIIIGLSILITADIDLTLDKATGVLLGLFAWRYMNRAIQSPTSWQIALLIFGFLGLGFVALGVLNAEWINKVAILTPVIEQLPNQILTIPEQASGGIHPNQTAGTILFFFPLLWSVLLGHSWAKFGWQKWLWLGLSLLATAVLILTQSRSGWLGGAAAIYILCVLWAISLPPGNRSRRILFAFVGLTSLAGLTSLLIIDPTQLAEFWQDPAQETAVGSFSSLNFRQEVWRWTIVAIQDFSFTGIGLGSFRRVIRRLYPLGVDPSYEVAHAHNIYLHTAVDVGIPGLIIYLAMVGLVLWLGWQVVRSSQEIRPYALGLIVGIIAFHVYGIGDTLALGSKTGLTFWVALGLITTLHKLYTNPNSKSQPDKIIAAQATTQLANQE